MRITRIESIILLDKLHIVKVHTDEGLVGVGEVSPMNAHVSHSVVEQALAPLLIGEEATDIERLWRRLYTKPYKLGPGGAQLNAIAGIDIALWDLLGKAAGLPTYKLLGGKYRQSMKVYASSMARGMTPQEEAERAQSFQEKGFHGYKIHSSTPWMHDDGFDQTIETVAAVRGLVGDDFPILVDVNNAYYEHTAIKLAHALEELGVWHFEEPLAAHDYAAYGRLADAVDIPIAVGEQEYTSWQFRELILQGRVDILQPDVIKCGGITESGPRLMPICGSVRRPASIRRSTTSSTTRSSTTCRSGRTRSSRSTARSRRGSCPVWASSWTRTRSPSCGPTEVHP
jgi:D-arabinonate dehydratase/D-galactarolactone cycloisomerase